MPRPFLVWWLLFFGWWPPVLHDEGKLPWDVLEVLLWETVVVVEAGSRNLNHTAVHVDLNK